MPDQMEYGQKFFENFYVPKNVSLVIVGDVDPAQTMQLVKQTWGQWPSKGRRCCCTSRA